MTTNPPKRSTISRRSDLLPKIGSGDCSSRSVIQCLAIVLLVVMSCTQTGCQIFHRFGKAPRTTPVIYESLPSQQELLETIEDRNQKAKQLNTNVTVTIPGAPKIKGTIQVEFPNRLRLKAGLLGMSEMGVDVGSNDDQFWFWSKAALPGQEPALYYADYRSFQRSEIAKTIPVDPKWLIEAIGLLEFDPSDVHYGPIKNPDGRLDLYTVQQTPSGPQTRVTSIGASSGLVERQVIYDASNRIIAYSDSSNYRHYPQDHVSLPQQITLHMFQPDGTVTKLSVELGTFSINSLYGDPNKMWAMPDPAGIPKIDLAELSSISANLGQLQSDPR